MTVQDVVYTEIIYLSLVALLEIPTGYAADRWSRKWMMVVGGLSNVLEFGVLIAARSFWHFAVAVAIAAIGNAATSGTSNALLYDTLKELGQTQEFEKLAGRIRAAKYAAHMTAALLGAVVASRYGLLSTYWLSLVSAVLSLIFSLTLVEPRLRTIEESVEADKGLTRQALAFLKESAAIRFVLFYGVVLGACLNYLDEFWQLYLDHVGVPIILWGLISGSTSLLIALGSLYAHRVKQRISYKVLFAFILLVFAAGLILMAVVQNPVGLLLMLLAYGAVSFVDPLVSGYLHHRTPSEFRATAESYQALVLRGVTVLVGLAFGYVSSHYSISKGFLMIGVLALTYLAVFVASAGKLLDEQTPGRTEPELRQVDA
jgi:MFS family permease